MAPVHEFENVFMNGSSHLEVICGPMFCGKTEELIRRIRRIQYAKLRAIVFKPHIDKRYSDELVVSHSAQKIPSITVNNTSEIKKYLASKAYDFHAVAIDEVQFFDDSVVSFCEELVSSGIRVIAAGLCEDYMGKPFGPMPTLLTHADTITKLWAVCMKCGRPASKTQRIARNGSAVKKCQVLVGADKSYEARCRGCHKKVVLEESLLLNEMPA